MQSLYFLAMLLGVAWLCAWSILPPAYRKRGWWPFDMRSDAMDGADATQPDDHAHGKTPLRRETTAAATQPPVTTGRPAESWRLRRAQGAGFRRQR